MNYVLQPGDMIIWHSQYLTFDIEIVVSVNQFGLARSLANTGKLSSLRSELTQTLGPKLTQKAIKTGNVYHIHNLQHSDN